MSTTISSPAGFFWSNGVTPESASDLQSVFDAIEASGTASAAAAASAASAAVAASASADAATSAASGAIASVNSTATAAEATINTAVTDATTTLSAAAAGAATSASNAASSASGAATSATNAASSATGAASSATAAAASASAASGSASAASSSATNAATSATSASSSATAAAASVGLLGSISGLVSGGVTDNTAVIQAAINAGATELIFPRGTFAFAGPLVSNGTLTVRGAGPFATTLLQTTASADGWQHGTLGTPATGFQMYGLSLKCSGVGGAAIRCSFDANTPQFTLRDVNISGSGNQTTNYWHDAVIAVGPSIATIDHCKIDGINGGNLVNVGSGITLSSLVTASRGTYMMTITNSVINYYQNAILLDSTGRASNTNLQGVDLRWVNSVGCMEFVRVTGPILELNITNCQYEGFGSALYGDSIDTCVFKNNLVFIDASGANTIVAQYPQDIIQAKLNSAWISDNRFVLLSGAVASQVLNVLTGSNRVKFYDNITWTQSATLSGLISIASGASAVKERGTLSAFWTGSTLWVNGNMPTGSQSCVSATYSKSLINASNQRLTVDVDDGTLALTGSVASTTDASGNQTVTLPTGLFNSVTTVIVSNGDSGVTTGGVNLTNSTVAKTGFTVSWPGAVSTARRVNYIAYGLY